MRKCKARKRVERSVKKFLNLEDHNRRERLKSDRDNKYKPKYKKRKKGGNYEN